MRKGFFKTRQRVVVIGTLLLVTAGASWWARTHSMRKQPPLLLHSIGQALQKKIIQLKEPLVLKDDEISVLDKTFKHTERYSPFHALFAKASISIEKGEKQKALEETLHLEKELASSNQAGSFLHAYTLVRRAFLYQSLGQIEREKETWHTIQTLSATSGTKGFLENLSLIEKSFSCEGSDLRDYIQYRLAIISPWFVKQ